MQLTGLFSHYSIRRRPINDSLSNATIPNPPVELDGLVV